MVKHNTNVTFNNYIQDITVILYCKVLKKVMEYHLGKQNNINGIPSNSFHFIMFHMFPDLNDK